jgi:hypothetical protein
MKTCSHCKSTKSFDGFAKDRTRIDGYNTSCRECTTESRSKLRLAVINKYGGKCVCCDEDKTDFLVIDHVKGGGRKELKGRGPSVLRNKLLKHPISSDYQVLCHNCNLAKGFYGRCPHEV